MLRKSILLKMSIIKFKTKIKVIATVDEYDNDNYMISCLYCASKLNATRWF